MGNGKKLTLMSIVALLCTGGLVGACFLPLFTAKYPGLPLIGGGTVELHYKVSVWTNSWYDCSGEGSTATYVCEQFTTGKGDPKFKKDVSLTNAAQFPCDGFYDKTMMGLRAALVIGCLFSFLFTVLLAHRGCFKKTGHYSRVPMWTFGLLPPGCCGVVVWLIVLIFNHKCSHNFDQSVKTMKFTPTIGTVEMSLGALLYPVCAVLAVSFFLWASTFSLAGSPDEMRDYLTENPDGEPKQIGGVNSPSTEDESNAHEGSSMRELPEDGLSKI